MRHIQNVVIKDGKVIDPGYEVHPMSQAWLDWRPIKSAPTDRFILLYCPEDESRWLAKWQGGVWYGVDVEHGLTREGHSLGNPDVVTGWFVTQWADVPAAPPQS